MPRLPLEPNKITKLSAARAVSPVHPQQERIPLVLEAEDVTVARVGERHRRDEVAHTLITSGSEPVDPDRCPTA